GDHGVGARVQARLVDAAGQQPDVVRLALHGGAQCIHLVPEAGVLDHADRGFDVLVAVVRCAGRVRQALDLHDHHGPPSRGWRAGGRSGDGPSVAWLVTGWRYAGTPRGMPSSLAPLPYARITEVRFPGWSLRISALRP